MRPHFMKLIPNGTVTFFLKTKKKMLNWCQINGEVDTFSRYSNLYELSSYIILASFVLLTRDDTTRRD